MILTRWENYKKTSFIFSISFIFCFLIKGQSQELAGVIKNKKLEGIPYANIGIPSKAFGVITDENGNFTIRFINEKETDTIQITSIGYSPVTMSIADFKKNCTENIPLILIEEARQYQLLI